MTTPTSPSSRIRTAAQYLNRLTAIPQREPAILEASAQATTKPRRAVKAIVQDRFGPPDQLRLAGIDPPGIGPGEVLIRVHAAALNPYDWHMLRGDPYIARLMGGTGLTRPRSRVAGIDAAGRVEAAGAGVHGLRPGQDVLGFCRGAFAEYARTRADLVVPKPDSLSFEQAAALPMAATTALRGIRDVAQVQAGQQVLVNGAAGGVGNYAVQIAAALGAKVTGVCSTRNLDLVRSARCSGWRRSTPSSGSASASCPPARTGPNSPPSPRSSRGANSAPSST